ncbi:hypothetical protein JCM15415_08650 [Methanobacterium movens]
MNYKTVLIVIMSVVVILLSGYVVAMNMQNQDDETNNMTQIRFADNGSTSFSIGNTSPERSVSHTRPPVNNNNNPGTGNTTPVDDGENNTQSS